MCVEWQLTNTGLSINPNNFERISQGTTYYIDSLTV